MLWFLFSILTAFFESMKDVFSKKSLRNVDEYAAAFSLRLFALPFLFPLLFFIEIPSLGKDFWTALLLGGLLNVLSTIIYMKALRGSELSISVPMLTFTPAFLLITSPIMLGEFPNPAGFLGIILIVFGSYTLNIKEKHKGQLAPLKALLKERGPKYMLAVAFIWSMTSNFDKIGVLNSSPIFWVIAIDTFLALALFPIFLWKSQESLKQISGNMKCLIPLGLSSVLTLVFQMTAITMTLVAYVISVKRTSAIMGVVMGHFLFREKGIKERLAGAVLMVTGVALITLS